MNRSDIENAVRDIADQHDIGIDARYDIVSLVERMVESKQKDNDHLLKACDAALWFLGRLQTPFGAPDGLLEVRALLKATIAEARED